MLFSVSVSVGFYGDEASASQISVMECASLLEAWLLNTRPGF